MPFWRVALPITRQLRRFSNMAQDSEWRRVPATTEIPTHSVFLKEIEKPETDDRDYRLIRLENGLQALLIHDPKADKAAAAMDVGVGHLSDPVSTQFFQSFLLSWRSHYASPACFVRTICPASLISVNTCFLWALPNFLKRMPTQNSSTHMAGAPMLGQQLATPIISLISAQITFLVLYSGLLVSSILRCSTQVAQHESSKRSIRSTRRTRKMICGEDIRSQKL